MLVCWLIKGREVVGGCACPDMLGGPSITARISKKYWFGVGWCPCRSRRQWYLLPTFTALTPCLSCLAEIWQCVPSCIAVQYCCTVQVCCIAVSTQHMCRSLLALILETRCFSICLLSAWNYSSVSKRKMQYCTQFLAAVSFFLVCLVDRWRRRMRRLTSVWVSWCASLINLKH